MENKIYLIYKLTGVMVNQGNFDERFVTDELVIGYFEGTEEEVQKLCKRYERESNQYIVPEDNEHIYYPQFHYWDLPKLP
ncbi:hypothetical protein [Lysinibacillus odysseyi]|uniref:Uncharacterized protein n=1 Tax=Lysinibacillus odysseyi 34hs-1 = NBRC 100172 TaxID=1220589 RepID=A0A0A3J130_9BACI|nr:hypothetical protein [Lysinibacillus odysseyi]KGR89415.1 hypothetical protein CD32_00325 [Lysinibacillus odysseyi 34hs-1 = NBRC 100172]